MTEQQEAAMRQALEAMTYFADQGGDMVGALGKIDAAITALRQALEQQPADGTQVSKVWWDGEKLMAKPIPLSEFYKEPEQPPADEPVVKWDSDGWGDLLVDSLPDGTLLYTRPQPAGEPVAWMCSDKALIQMGYKKFADTPDTVWNIPVYTHPQPAAPQQKDTP